MESYGTTWCEKCGQRPAVAVVSSADTAEPVHLCAQCAAAWEASGHAWAAGAGELLARLTKPGDREALLCPRCGFDLEDVVRRGRVGCPECYGAFEPVVSELLSKVITNPTHNGKRPRAWHNGRPPRPTSRKPLQGSGL